MLANYQRSTDLTTPEVTICPGYLSPRVATELYTQLCERIDWDLRISARKTACFGLPYNYSGLTYEVQPMHPLLQPLCRQLAQTLGFEPNSCLVNFYKDGRDKMGFHSDDIDNLEDGTQIIIISLGTERKLSFRSKADYEQRLSYLLPHGSLLYMSQKTQEFWSHAIKRANVMDGRISLTFRRIDPLYRALPAPTLEP
ncbi:alpha-ketoglutarate-dependent dioxygenase AlkB [Chamaesiphon sp. OTE_20_metabat_361]|uniref:alpha-ketoglutarate-dependent dioxygenase AlkB family protein n=1 Tax=Chamaesiphon sp. OTE_20_metabat_361 TaxID=2964689 RepID=UPI00286CED93|nr:alpha-ketoglutarate-dependent dioxygenase AlkB [Chamaesiphon sp. OTE_20_metabat_361]